jgi:hypothetical protein
MLEGNTLAPQILPRNCIGSAQGQTGKKPHIGGTGAGVRAPRIGIELHPHGFHVVCVGRRESAFKCHAAVHRGNRLTSLSYTNRVAGSEKGI